ncbi:MAG: imidazole glycerol phosphate synthase subunit HisH [Planctomycetes bacterium]|nr:imidazole glycerol phosphate synthase subunit HisH [Planctomycetota bacterium]
MNKVAIIDYGMCNLDSIARAVQECGGSAVVTDRREDLRQASHVVLPGVGAFPNAMRNLESGSLPEVLRDEVVEKQIPILGICLGMQLLATTGHELEHTAGLGLIDGEVNRLCPSNGERVPHVGWNEVHYTGEDCPLFDGIPEGTDFYFVHSFHFSPVASTHVLGRTPHSGNFTSVVGRDLIFGVQFHPEKSQGGGFQVLRNFLAI